MPSSLYCQPRVMSSSFTLAPQRLPQTTGTAGRAALPVDSPLHRSILSPTGAVLGTMDIEENGQLLVGRWLCESTPANLVTGLGVALELLGYHPCRAILSDGSEATGDWSDMRAWVEYEVLPQLVSLGVRFVANVRNPDPAGRLAHQKYAQYASNFLTINIFDDPATARKWLRPLLRRSYGAI